MVSLQTQSVDNVSLNLSPTSQENATQLLSSSFNALFGEPLDEISAKLNELQYVVYIYVCELCLLLCFVVCFLCCISA